jgi:hypothetical protein
MDAGEDHDAIAVCSIPHHIGKSPQQRSAVSSVALRADERVIRDAPDDLVQRYPGLAAEALALGLIPVLDLR